MINEYSQSKWDLSDLVSDHKSKDFQKKIENLKININLFEEKKNLLRNDIDIQYFKEILRGYENIIEEISLLRNYSNLLFVSNTSNPEGRALVAKIESLSATLINRILFFSQWWKKGINENNSKRLLGTIGILKYYLTRQREMSKYTLSELEEKIINIKDSTGIDFIQRLYDQYTEGLNFRLKIDNKISILTKSQLIPFFRSPITNYRRAAYRTLLRVYTRNEDILGELYRMVVLNWRDEEVDLRGHESPLSARNFINDIPDEAVDTLLHICRKNCNIFQDFFKQKSSIIGMKSFSRYHIYAPIGKSEKKYSFNEAVKIVLNSLKDFSPKMFKLAKKVFTENHLDSEIRKGKRSGAFCSTVSPKITPYVLINYAGRQEDIFTLAHELGHAIHSLFASDKSVLVQNAPLPLAELASIFSEMILFEDLSCKVSEEERIRLIGMHLDDLYATILRQAYFTIFEKEAHNAVSEGVTQEEISKIYFNNLEEQFGGALYIPEKFKIEWTYIPHIYHTPFYTYAYTFGNLLSASLYQRFKKDGKDFVNRYIEMLSAGGSKKPEILLENSDINIRSGITWENGFNYIKDMTSKLANL